PRLKAPQRILPRPKEMEPQAIDPVLDRAEGDPQRPGALAKRHPRDEVPKDRRVEPGFAEAVLDPEGLGGEGAPAGLAAEAGDAEGGSVGLVGAEAHEEAGGGIGVAGGGAAGVGGGGGPPSARVEPSVRRGGRTQKVELVTSRGPIGEGLGGPGPSNQHPGRAVSARVRPSAAPRRAASPRTRRSRGTGPRP